jgi:hypothetical protein
LLQLEFLGVNFLYLVYQNQLLSLLVALSVIVLKNDRDALQGINKLGYLLKVSVFQKYKIHPPFYSSTLASNVEEGTTR